MRPSLTYKDVRTILALLDGWRSGSVHFQAGALTVDAVTGDADSTVEHVIASPAVGRFVPDSNLSEVLSAGSRIGKIEAPRRSTPVTLADGGRVAALLVSTEEFVEYGQPLALLKAKRA